MAIYFYAQNEPFGEFSNFAPFGVEIDGLWWPTVEYYIQAQKFSDTNYQEQIRNVSSPKRASEMGRTRTVALRADWENVKDAVMLRAVRKKFQTHPQLADLLLKTDNEELIESAPGDFY